MFDWVDVLPSIFAGLFGLLIGSFLNVVIYRLPRDLSIVRPRSQCPGCGKQVRAWDNVPLLSYAVLRGRCRDCSAPISIRYPLVEALTGLLFAWFVGTQGLTLIALRDCIMSALFLALIFTDLETRLLPEPLTIGGIVTGLIFSLLTPVNSGLGHALGLSGRLASFCDSAIGAVIPAFLLWSLGWAFEKVRHQEGLGFGDVVMIAEVGAFLGLQAAFLTLFLAAIAGSLIGGAVILLNRENHRTYELPLGSFLGAAGIVVILIGTELVHWYAGFYR